jgi:CheY-like chemotaxis protein
MKNFVAQGTRRLLVVEDNPTEQRTIVELLGDNDIEIATASTGTEAFETLLDRPFDCCVLDLRLPDMTGFELLDRIQQEPSLREVPVVVFTGKELSTLEQDRLRTAAKSVVL